jgi:hypothetical protein
MVIAARWVRRQFGLDNSRPSLVAVGVAALVLQQIADIVVGRTLRSLTLADQLAAFATPEGLVHAALLAAFAAMPVIAGYFRPKLA